MTEYFEGKIAPSNTWLGVSVEDRKYGVPRIDHLRHVNASIRFLSVEPLLEDIGEIDLSDIHWVIVGGESGPKARPMKPEWVDAIQEHCKDSGVAFFFKQWGGWGADGKRRAKKQNGRILNGRTWDEMPMKALQDEDGCPGAGMTEVHYEWAPGQAYPRIQQHSVAKHEILRAYLIAYIRTLTSNPNREEFRLALIDGFAGGGVYQHAHNGKELLGSPFIMLDAAKEANS